jgi:hypothetical protein
VDGDGDLDGDRDGILLDTDGNGVPESLDASGTDVTLVDNKTGKVLPGWPLSLGTLTWSVKAVAGDADNDGRVEVFVPSIDGALYCYRLGVGSYQFTNLFEPGEPTWVNRSMVKDPFEPNGSVATAHPLTFPTKEIRGYLTKGDVDYYRLPGVGGLFLQLHSPPGLDYDLYWYGTDESKVFAQVTGTGTLDQVARCVGCTETPPAFYTVKIVPKNPAKDFSASRPYVLKVNKVP